MAAPVGILWAAIGVTVGTLVTEETTAKQVSVEIDSIILFKQHLLTV